LTLSPTPSSTTACYDTTGWTDYFGDNCDWYEQYDSAGCPNYGNYWANPTTGVTPNEACCWCGGGSMSTEVSSIIINHESMLVGGSDMTPHQKLEKNIFGK
jgi:hypothetical protein